MSLRILIHDYKEVVSDVPECTNADPEPVKNILTGNQTGAHDYDFETKLQSSQ